MVAYNSLKCPNCGGYLRFYDRVLRLIRTKGYQKKYVNIRRLQCCKCGKIHRELPNTVYPYKHYESEIIKGVIEGHITPHTIGYEDYPCETTMNRWIRTYK